MTTERARLGLRRTSHVRSGPPSSRLWRIGLALLPIVALIVVWWIATIFLARPRVYPSPLLVAQALGDIIQGRGAVGSTYLHIGATLGRLGAAFAFALVVGTTLGVIAGRIPIVFSLLENVVWVFLAVPSIVWVFIFAVGLGISNFVPVAAISALLTPMILINVAEGANPSRPTSSRWPPRTKRRPGSAPSICSCHISCRTSPRALAQHLRSGSSWSSSRRSSVSRPRRIRAQLLVRPPLHGTGRPWGIVMIADRPAR